MSLKGQMINSVAYVDATFQYERINDVSHWIPVDEPKKLSDIITKYYTGK